MASGLDYRPLICAASAQLKNDTVEQVGSPQTDDGEEDDALSLNRKKIRYAFW